MAKKPKHRPFKTVAPSEVNTTYYDIECAPNIGEYWDVKQPYNIIRTLRYSYMLSVAWQVNDGPIQYKGLPDFKTYKTDKHDDYELVKFLHDLISKADISIGHNGDNFDDKYSNARFIFHRLGPTPPRKTRDTLKLSKKVTKQVSHRLDELARYYGIGAKLPHTGKHLWQECTDEVYHHDSWNTMKRYNKHDVYLLKEVAKLLLPWDSSPAGNSRTFTGIAANCSNPACQQPDLIRQGKKRYDGYWKQRWQCKSCGKYTFETERNKLPKPVFAV